MNRFERDTQVILEKGVAMRAIKLILMAAFMLSLTASDDSCDTGYSGGDFSLYLYGSLHPLYSENDSTFDPGLLGSWFDAETEDTLTFGKKTKAAVVGFSRFVDGDSQPAQMSGGPVQHLPSGISSYPRGRIPGHQPRPDRNPDSIGW